VKIIRHLDPQSRIAHSELQADGSALLLKGDLFSGFQSTKKNRGHQAPSSSGPHSNSRHWPQLPTTCHGNGVKVSRTPRSLLQKHLLDPESGRPHFSPRHLRSDRVDYECELAVIIGRDCKNISASKAFEYVAGYTCANDVSARDWQQNAGGDRGCRGKSFDPLCPLGPCLVTPDEIPDPQNLKIRTLLNGEAVQDWSTNDMIFTVAQIIEFLSGSTTLPAGTVILTGTPHGVGMASTPPRWLRPGDQVAIEIEKIGSLTNPVAQELTP